jgi:hypothetical protein
MADVEIPHLAWPLTLANDGALAQVEEGTIEDVRQCVRVLLLTPLRVRPLAPDIGVEDPTFAPVDEAALAARLEELDDRARVSVIASPPDAAGEQQIEVRVGLVDDPDDDQESTA